MVPTKIAEATGYLTDDAKGRAAAAESRAKVAEQAAVRAMPAIEAARINGASSLRGIATVLNGQDLFSAGGGAWSAMAVQRVLARVEAKATMVA